MCRTMALFALTCLLVASAPAADENRTPVPPPAEVEKSTKLIRELFKEEYAKTQPKARLALIERLFKEAEETNDDPAGRYALYREVAELSAATGEVNSALEALNALHLRYRGVKPEQDEPVLKALTTKAAPAEALILANHLLRAVDDAVEADDLDSAERLAALAVTAANRAKVLRTSSLATARVKDVEAFKRDAPQVKAALKALENGPTDPAASAVAGKYYCFQREQWEKGLPLLVAGNDAKLKAVAEKDRAAPKEPTELLALADGWYDLEAPAHFKRSILGRAFTFYTKATPDLTGLNRTRAEKRVEELEKVVEARSPFEDFWGAVRTAVRGKDVEDLIPPGGLVGRKEFRDTPPTGGVLIGFNYAIHKLGPFGQEIIGYLQPIYLTPTGEKLGTGFGKAPAKPLTVKAKPGYAVGAVQVVGRGLVEGCAVTFMRIQGKGLNPADKYTAPVFGRSLEGSPVLGDGRPIVGLFGKFLERGADEFLSFGLVAAGPKPAKKP
jgi:hypothetical protein